MTDSDGREAESVDIAYGKGSILAIGSYPGNAFRVRVREHEMSLHTTFEKWLAAELSDVGIDPLIRGNSDSKERFPTFARTGTSTTSRLVFVFAQDVNVENVVKFDPARVLPGRWHDIMSDTVVEVGENGTCVIPASRPGVAVLSRERDDATHSETSR